MARQRRALLRLLAARRVQAGAAGTAPHLAPLLGLRLRRLAKRAPQAALAADAAARRAAQQRPVHSCRCEETPFTLTARRAAQQRPAARRSASVLARPCPARVASLRQAHTEVTGFELNPFRPRTVSVASLRQEDSRGQAREYGLGAVCSEQCTQSTAWRHGAANTQHTAGDGERRRVLSSAGWNA